MELSVKNKLTFLLEYHVDKWKDPALPEGIAAIHKLVSATLYGIATVAEKPPHEHFMNSSQLFFMSHLLMKEAFMCAFHIAEGTDHNHHL